MNALITTVGVPATMTSREIADLAGKRHDNVLPVCKSLKETGVCPEIQETPYVSEQNSQTYVQFLLSKRDSFVLIARLSPEFTAKLVDRWQELEETAANPIANMSRTDILRLALDSEEKRVALETQVTSMAPKVAALERIAESDGLLNPTGAAKALQLQPKRVFEYLRTHGWTYRRAGGRSDVAYQDKIAAGYLTHKVHIAHREDGSERVCEQVMVTPKGLAKLAQDLGAH